MEKEYLLDALVQEIENLAIWDALANAGYDVVEMQRDMEYAARESTHPDLEEEEDE